MKKAATYHFQCVDCGSHYIGEAPIYLCPPCMEGNQPGQPPRGVLKTLYDYDTIRSYVKTFKRLKDRNFLDLMPLKDLDHFPKLRIGQTPLYYRHQWNGETLPFNLHLKDDSQNPTYSFKDRASAMVSAHAKEIGEETIVVASTGNAGSSMAGICASQGQKAIVLVPASAPPGKILQIRMYGATIVPVAGSYDDAFDLSVQATSEFGWYNRNTAYNPLTIEGKKTVAFELFDQLDQTLPDTVFVPVGDGVILAGVYKGFEDLKRLGLTGGMPTIVAVQSEGSDNLVRNARAQTFESKKSQTVADSISVDVPRNFYMAANYLQKYRGEPLVISDARILEASVSLAKNYGLFAEPAAAAAFAGFLHYKEQNKLTPGGNHVVLLTGSGLKDPGAFDSIFKPTAPIEPGLDQLMQFLHDTV